MHFLLTLIPIFILSLLLTSPFTVQSAIHHGPQCAQIAPKSLPSEDIKVFATKLQTENPNALTELPGTTSTYYEHGSLRVCVYNDYWFKTTHVADKEVGRALQVIYDKCCAGKGKDCIGGYAQGRGDSGIYIDILTWPAGMDCD
ncbi:MAG: hypothetical protein Q9213_004363 [Squamulea squamosa]